MAETPAPRRTRDNSLYWAHGRNKLKNRRSCLLYGFGHLVLARPCGRRLQRPIEWRPVHRHTCLLHRTVFSFPKSHTGHRLHTQTTRCISTLQARARHSKPLPLLSLLNRRPLLHLFRNLCFPLRELLFPSLKLRRRRLQPLLLLLELPRPLPEFRPGLNQLLLFTLKSASLALILASLRATFFSLTWTSSGPPPNSLVSSSPAFSLSSSSFSMSSSSFS